MLATLEPFAEGTPFDNVVAGAGAAALRAVSERHNESAASGVDAMRRALPSSIGRATTAHAFQQRIGATR